jgi:hypothetical protein
MWRGYYRYVPKIIIFSVGERHAVPRLNLLMKKIEKNGVIMTTLKSNLKNSDGAILNVIAQFWGIKDPVKLGVQELTNRVYAAMTDPAQAEAAWQKLDDTQRGALQMLLTSGSKMALPMFERLHGEIRKMGTGAIEREKPLENPASVAESLYYRGLIFDSFEKTATGIRPIVVIPPELVEALPYHQTTYDNLDDDLEAEEFPDDDSLTVDEFEAEEVEGIQPADTTIVDDMTALLGYLQVHGGEITTEGDLNEEDRKTLLPQLLNKDEIRLTFVFKLAMSADLIGAQGKHVSPRRAEARRWLEGSRSEQLKRLVQAWRKSTTYRDLWHVPGLFPEPAGWPYDPTVGRESMSEFLQEFAPRQGWWSPDAFITRIKETEPDFQRPGGGDYDSWYIRNAGGEYLTGFESWDAVEGSLLLFLLTGPMYWLGMMDVADSAVRLTAYGRAFIGLEKWPTPQPVEASIQVKENGALLISRRVPRIDRFQAMRFTTWGDPGQGSPYSYTLDAQGIQQADFQGINIGHITAFLSRILGNTPIPQPITHLLETWQSGPSANVTIERLFVLRTTAPETMDFIVNTPALRRYLGARLGEMAVVVRPDQWEALQEALGAHGVDVAVRQP